MPRDKNGHELHIGDQVMIPATIRAVSDTGAACDIGLDTDVDMLPGYKVNIGLHGRQVELVSHLVLVPIVMPEVSVPEPPAEPAPAPAVAEEHV